MNTIVLVGAGNIGSRHLQGLAKISIPVKVMVVDPDQNSLEISKKRLEEASPSGNATVEFYSFSDLPLKEIDLLIICTNSKIRKNVYFDFVEKYVVKNVVFEKFLFTELEEYDVVEEDLKKRSIKAWVNCARRMFPVYRELKELLATEKRFEFSVSGSNWGIGCNSVHYLDLFSFLSNATDFTVSGDLLDKNIVDSKRTGYIEFTGTLTGRDAGNNLFLITSMSSENLPITITIHTERYHMVILEKSSNSEMSIADKSNGLRSTHKVFQMPFQSGLSNILAEKILQGEDPFLPEYSVSAALHQSILKVFINQLQNFHNDKTIKSCPVT